MDPCCVALLKVRLWHIREALIQISRSENCEQLAIHFVDTIEQKYGREDEVRLIFDRYDLPMSLKEATREKRQGGQDPIYY